MLVYHTNLLTWRNSRVIEEIQVLRGKEKLIWSSAQPNSQRSPHLNCNDSMNICKADQDLDLYQLNLLRSNSNYVHFMYKWLLPGEKHSLSDQKCTWSYSRTVIAARSLHNSTFQLPDMVISFLYMVISFPNMAISFPNMVIPMHCASHQIAEVFRS